MLLDDDTLLDEELLVLLDDLLDDDMLLNEELLVLLDVLLDDDTLLNEELLVLLDVLLDDDTLLDEELLLRLNSASAFESLLVLDSDEAVEVLDASLDEMLDDVDEETAALLTLPAAALDDEPTALPPPVQADVSNAITAK